MRNARLIPLAATFLLLLGGAQARAGTITLDLFPDPLSATGNTTVIAGIRISGLSASQQVGSFDVDLHYNSDVLLYSGTAFAPELGVSFTSDTVIQPGILNLLDVSLENPVPAQPSSFLLASVTFNAVTDGPTNFSLVVNQVGDALGNSLLTPVPEPSTGGLLLGGCVLLFGVLWPRRAARKTP